MKPLHIGILISAIVIFAIIFTTVFDGTTYSDFNSAKQNPGKMYSIIGKLSDSSDIKEHKNSNGVETEFRMTDEKNNTCMVIYKGNKPRDFELTEQIVVKGKMTENYFEATEILLKCPSKYNQGKPVGFGDTIIKQAK